MEIGKRIKAKRKALGMSALDLARRAKCSPGLIGQYECGILPKNLHKGAIARVKKILRVRVRGAAKPSKPKQVGRPRLSDTERLFRVLVDMQGRMARIERRLARLNERPNPVIPPMGVGVAVSPNPEALAA